MTTTTLPACKWRGAPTRRGRHPCSSPLLRTAACGVTADFCRSCPAADRDLPPALAGRGRGRPGAELAAMLSSLGLHGEQGCGCDDFAAEMDRWGVEGCRARAAEIAAHLRVQAERVGRAAKLKAGLLAVTQGLPLTYEGLVEEAIRRAERKGAARAD